MAKSKPTEPRVQPEGKALLDDLFLNEGERVLEDMASRCERELGHKPSMEDFRNLLEVLLGAELERYFADCDTVELVEVVFKTRKKPRAQRYQEGDVFAIPLGDRLYAFGRVLRIKPKFGELIEVFRETSERKTCRRSITESGRLFHPVIVNGLTTIEVWRWTVVHSDSSYRLSEADAKLEFVYPKHPKKGWVAGNPFDHEQPHRLISAEEAQQMTDNALLGPEDVENLIRAALKTRDAAGEKP